MSRVYFRGSSEKVREIAYRLAGMLTGNEPDAQNVARGVFLTLGFSALSSIQDDFITKARGGVGADGVQWPPLSPKTLAYSRRFGPGEKAKLKKAAGLGRGHSKGPGGKPGLLNAAQLKRWRQVYGTRLARFLLSMPAGEAKARAAQIAWATVKAEGAKTMLEVFGKRQVDILRDTGVLFNSLSPGELGGSGTAITYIPPSGDGSENQLFQPIANGVIVGTTVAYAESHQNGDPSRNVPARPFLPTGDVPEVWEERWIENANDALAVGARSIFEAMSA